VEAGFNPFASLIATFLPSGTHVEPPAHAGITRDDSMPQATVAPHQGSVVGVSLVTSSVDEFRQVLARLLALEEGLDRVFRAIQAHALPSAEWLSIKEAAVLTSLSATHVRRGRRAGSLPASNVGDVAHPIWRIRRTDLDQWMEAKKGGTRKVPPRSELGSLVGRYFGD
jgi:excisionase family DNA binding protein